MIKLQFKRCEYCGTEEPLPFKCPLCHGYFCPEHRVPEDHECHAYLPEYLEKYLKKYSNDWHPHEFAMSELRRIFLIAGASRVARSAIEELGKVLRAIGLEVGKEALHRAIHAGRKTVRIEDVKAVTIKVIVSPKKEYVPSVKLKCLLKRSFGVDVERNFRSRVLSA